MILRKKVGISMKVVGLNGSYNREGNTYLTITAFFEELQKEGIETELLQVGDGSIAGCTACRGCHTAGECVVHDETFVELSDKIINADGVLLAAPVYFGTLPGQMKAVLDRFFFQSLKTGRMRHKVGATAAILRRTGGYTTIDDLNRFVFAGEMISVGQCIIHGDKPGEILQDTEGLAILRRNARNMAWVLKMKELTKSELPPPPYEKRPMMNFIR